MPTNTYRTFASAAVRLSAVWLMAAFAGSGAPLSDLSGRATAVVVGTVASWTSSPGGAVFDIATERVLQGRVGGAVHIQHAWALPSSTPTGSFSVSLRGTWFLTETASGQWDVLPARDGVLVDKLFLPALPAPLPVPYAYPANASLLDALVFETAAGLASPGQSPEVLLDALGATDDPAVETVLSAYLASPSAALKAVGLSGLLYRGRPGALATLSQTWPSISAEPRRSFVLSALADSWRDSTPQAVQQLGAIASQAAPGNELRAPSFRALAAMHSAEALPVLAQLLQSPRSSEQVLGVFALASFANGCPMQTIANTVSMAYLQCGPASPYRTSDTFAHFALPGSSPADVAAAVSFWQRWWDQHGELH